MLSLDEPPAAVTSRIVLESKSRVAVPMADDAVSLAFLHEQVYVPTKISVIVNFLEESGVAAEQVLAGTRLRSSTRWKP